MALQDKYIGNINKEIKLIERRHLRQQPKFNPASNASLTPQRTIFGAQRVFYKNRSNLRLPEFILSQ